MKFKWRGGQVWCDSGLDYFTEHNIKGYIL